MSEQGTRQGLALSSACEVATRIGLEVTGARVLLDAHNTLVLLPAAGIVAKVSTSTLEHRGQTALRRELSIGRHLSARKAPVVPPLLGSTGGPHAINGLLLTLWKYCESKPVPEAPGIELGHAMRIFHEALVDFPDPLPSVAEKLARASSLIADAGQTPKLAASDRQFLMSVSEKLQFAKGSLERKSLLHGEPHGGNVLWTREGPLFIDFEAACSGPLEWDLAYLPQAARRAYPDCDEHLLGVLEKAVSFCVAAWCFAQPGRAPEVDEAAHYHLDLLKRAPAE